MGWDLHLADWMVVSTVESTVAWSGVLMVGLKVAQKVVWTAAVMGEHLDDSKVALKADRLAERMVER